jgi:hypothetical protein
MRETLEREAFDEDRLDAARARVALAASRPAIARGTARRIRHGRDSQDVKPPAADRALADDSRRSSRVMPVARVTHRCLLGAGRVVLGRFHQFRSQQGILRQASGPPT